MNQITVTLTATKTRNADIKDGTWDIKVIGLNIEEAKKWTNSGYGKDWTIRYTMISEETYPCFLLQKRNTESAAFNLAESTIIRFQTMSDSESSFKNGIILQETPGRKHTFILGSTSTIPVPVPSFTKPTASSMILRSTNLSNN